MRGTAEIIIYIVIPDAFDDAIYSPRWLPRQKERERNGEGEKEKEKDKMERIEEKIGKRKKKGIRTEEREKLALGSRDLVWYTLPCALACTHILGTPLYEVYEVGGWERGREE